jgi:NAD(P)-dependent dehydrogenase (short-subunit alcohol dehydrogenase family)
LSLTLVAIIYLDEHEDAAESKRLVEAEGHRCGTYTGDIGDELFCQKIAARTVSALGHLGVLVNHAGEQHEGVVVFRETLDSRYSPDDRAGNACNRRARVRAASTADISIWVRHPDRGV